MISERIGGLTAKRGVIKEKEFQQKVKTKKVLIDVKVISEIFEFFVSRAPKESAVLLRGKIEGITWSSRISINARNPMEVKQKLQ